MTVAVFVTDGNAAAFTLVVSVIAGSELPAESGPGCVHVTTCPAAPQVQPVPTADTNPSPAGSVSVTVMGKSVGCEPGKLLTVSVYVPLVPTAKLPACDFAIA